MNNSNHYAHKVGIAYEYFVLEQIKNDYDKVWHWQDFPEKLMYDNGLINDYNIFCKYRYDIGADLVALKDGKYFFIQCKNYNDTILMENLAGFYFLLYEYNLTGVLYYNGKLSQRVLDLKTNKIQFINLPFNNSTIDIIEIKESPLIIRDYQNDAYNFLLNKKESILNLPCGMGKTFVTSLMAKHYDNIIILSPLRYLALQTLEQYKKYLGIEYSPILISVDGKRKIEDINNYIKGKNIISLTYDSADVLIKIINKLKNIYIIIDEFHNLSENNTNNNKNDMYKIINYNCDKIFVSATPLKDFMNITDIYTYNWKDAILNKYICDFNIFIPDKNENYELFVELVKKTCIDNTNDKIIKKAYFMLKSMLFNGDKKCICYMTTIEKASNMYDVLIWLSGLFGVEINLYQIDCNTKKTIRNKIIKNFKESLKISIMINVHILDEGINIVECDSVFISQPSNNMINIIQRMCRANRITENKSVCNIYLWCTEKKTEHVLEYIFENTKGFTKDKVFIYNTENKMVKKLNIANSINIDNIICEININNILTKDKLIEFIENNNIIFDKKNINVFFSLYTTYTTNTTNNDIVIDFDKLINWLNIRKDSIKRTLVDSYAKNIDYKISKIKSKKPGQPKEEILITSDCCKRLCMLSKTKKAEDIRTYIIDIEKLIDKYKNYIIDALNKKVNILENNQKINSK
jgi:superfamily II DNA or RNA helicase/phage anti-repressor protein